eukprot:TRINITY_DN2772_c0_g1_i3.p1 TRINITY_DN2772_c0_g1~~TRINITY_DN2772_c0_g1_i3.p1  ORF type:complete len:1113 (+),score=262.19 TRINITY_DN2772_c0_g1_i3:701-4039(+)
MEFWLLALTTGKCIRFNILLWESPDGLPITCVELFRPSEGVFQADVTLVLAVATEKNLYFLELLFPDDLIVQNVVLQPARVCVSLDTRIGCLASSPDGILVAGADNGEVYQIQYSTSWFRPAKCARVGSEGNQFTKIAASMIGPVYRSLGTLFTGKNSVIDLIFIDRTERRFFVALTSQFQIKRFGINGSGRIFFDKMISAPLDEFNAKFLSKFIKSVSDSLPVNVDFKEDQLQEDRIVKLVPIQNWESDEFFCAALLGKGAKLYLGAIGDSFGVTGVDIISQRQVEFSAPVFSRGGINLISLKPVQAGDVSDSVVLLVEQNNSRAKTFTRSKLQFSAEVIDLQEDRSALRDSLAAEFLERDGIRMESLSDGGLQHILGRRTLVCFAWNEIRQYVLENPVDVLVKLMTGPDAELKARKFLEGFVATEACCICLTFICSAHELPKYVLQRVDRAVGFVRSTFQPGVESSSLTEFSNQQRYIARWLETRAMAYFWKTSMRKKKKERRGIDVEDGVADGLLLFVSRILRPIWTVSLSHLDISDESRYDHSKRHEVLSLLRHIYAILLKLSAFLETDDMQYYLKKLALRDDSLTQESDERYSHNILTIVGLVDYIKKLQSTMNIFIFLAKQPDPSRILAYLPDAYKSWLPDYTISQFLDNSDLLRTVVKVIMRDNPVDMDWLETLRRQSPDIIFDEDIDYFAAINLLDDIQNRRTGDVEISKSRSMEMLKRSACEASFDLLTVVRKLIKLKLLDEAVQVCLYRADMLEHNRVEIPNNQVEVKLNECFNCLVETISFLWDPSLIVSNELRSVILRRLDKGKSSYLHENLYNYLVQNRFSSLLPQFRSKYVVEYLANSGRVEELIEYYHERQLYEEGARYCLETASNSQNQLLLDDRVELLKHGIEFASRMSELSPDSGLPWNASQNSMSVSSFSNSDTAFHLRSLYRIAKCQQDIVAAVRNRQADSPQLEELSKILVTSSRVLFQVASSHKLWEELIILKHCFRDQSSNQSTENIWDLAIAEVNSFEAVKDLVIRIGERVNTSELVFPVGYLLRRLSQIRVPSISLDQATLPMKCLGRSGVSLQRIAMAVNDALRVCICLVFCRFLNYSSLELGSKE